MTTADRPTPGTLPWCNLPTCPEQIDGGHRITTGRCILVPSPVTPEPPAETQQGDELHALLDHVYEHMTLQELVQRASRDGSYCCPHGCGSGACETCACCSAGWCVMGTDGLPEEPEDLARWLEEAAEHNPVAAALAARPSADTETLRARIEALIDDMDTDVDNYESFADDYLRIRPPMDTEAERCRHAAGICRTYAARLRAALEAR